MQSLQGSKAEVLLRLGGALKAARVLPLARISARGWLRGQQSDHEVARRFVSRNSPVIVRSSSRTEDTLSSSRAGQFLSVKDVRSWRDLPRAINAVIASYESPSDADEVLIQPMATGIQASGVVMTRDPESGAPYTIIEYSTAGDTDMVTSGHGSAQRIVTASFSETILPDVLKPLAAAIEEIDRATNKIGVDVEFGVADGTVLIFQCRPIVFRGSVRALDGDEFRARLTSLKAEADKRLRSAPSGLEGATLLGVMPDWNPAELIGFRPRPLALALYRHLITDGVWAQARAAYGYRNLGEAALIRPLGGLPYVDVRLSFTSFVPRQVDDRLATKVVDAAISKLRRMPHLHDKVEFSVMPTCYTPDLSTDDLSVLASLDDDDRALYVGALRDLTNSLLKLSSLAESDLRSCFADGAPLHTPDWPPGSGPIGKALTLLSETRAHETPLFARVARAAFIGTAILKSIERQTGRVGLVETVLATTKSIGAEIARDFSALEKGEFLRRHGHIRPGTYDIRVPTYAEDPGRYFDWSCRPPPPPHHARGIPADLVKHVDRQLSDHGLEIDGGRFIDWVKRAVEARERAKYQFCRRLSEALSLIAADGAAAGLSADQLSYLTLGDLEEWETTCGELVVVRAEVRKAAWLRASALRLPALLTNPSEVVSFACAKCEPTFVTRGVAEGPPRGSDATDLSRAIVMIESADPGYDWVFTKGIAGFVTCYGGENSHMAIRAREFGIPAVIGCGETCFERWRQARRLRVDCAGSQVEVMS